MQKFVGPGVRFFKASITIPIFLFAVGLLASVMANAAPAESLAFDTVDNGAPSAETPRIAPWKTITLDAEYGGNWFVAGDLDGGGDAEIVSARNVDNDDVHYTSAVAAQKLDGSALWRWGDPAIGRRQLHHDVACQIYDWNGDGQNEVVVCADKRLVELDGRTGKELRQWAIPEGASDCLVFCNLRGTPRAEDVLVKSRYEQIWAYGPDGTLLWTSKLPGGYRTAHQARPIDLDGDGKDEIMAGYAMLNADGSLRWTFQSGSVDLNRGHLDCMRVLEAGHRPEDFRLALTCCGANNIAVVNGVGETQWEISGHHFESIQIGNILPERPAPQILVDIDHQPRGQGPLWVIDAQGKPAAKILTAYARQHRLVEWTGDAYDEIFNCDNRTLYNNQGQAIAVLVPSPNTPATEMPSGGAVHLGDMTGDGVPDLILSTGTTAYIYKNEHGRKPAGETPLGTGANVTFY